MSATAFADDRQPNTYYGAKHFSRALRRCSTLIFAIVYGETCSLWRKPIGSGPSFPRFAGFPLLPDCSNRRKISARPRAPIPDLASGDAPVPHLPVKPGRRAAPPPFLDSRRSAAPCRSRALAGIGGAHFRSISASLLLPRRQRNALDSARFDPR